MKVKICGLTNKEDAVWAVNYGADYLGINFYKESPRHNTLASAEKWVSQLPSFAVTVGVFVNEDPKQVLHTATKLNLKGIQLHGDESAEEVAALKKSLKDLGKTIFMMKGIRMENEESLTKMPPYVDSVDYFLLDSFVEGSVGGTGQRFNWALAVQAKELGKPIFLAGGLNPGNVKEAVKKVAPYSVDVASGVEKSPRKKDVNLLQEFIRTAKG